MNIPLSPDKCLNPSIAVCPVCGEPVNEIVLAGNSNIWQCNDCGQKHIAYAGQAFCMKCPCGNEVQRGGTAKGVLGFTREGKFDGESDKVMSSEPCEKCKKEMAEERDAHASIVRQGGVYWKCGDCDSGGVIKPNAFTQAMRSELIERGILESPGADGVHNPCGVEFSKDQNCPACGSREE